MTNPHRYPLISLIGESGGGKSALLMEMTKRFPDSLAIFPALTTRARRGPEDDAFYEFVSFDDFAHREALGHILQSVEAFGNRYGTDRRRADAILEKQLGITIMVEEGIRNMKTHGYDVSIVRIIPMGHTPRDARHQEDKQRAEQFGLVADLTINNDFAPGGFTRASDELSAYIQQIQKERR